jgi:hypothetical protein
MVGLLSITVVAGLVTVWIAVVNRDSLVSDDWYKDGTAINQRLGRLEAAQMAGIEASISLSNERAIELELVGRDVDGVDRLRLDLRHPTIEARDRSVVLERGSDGMFRGAFAEPLRGRWYSTLEPVGAFSADDARAWRLSRTLQLPSSGLISLGGDG